MAKVKYQIYGCTRACAFNASHFAPEVAQKIHSWFEAGYSRDKILEEGAKLGFKFSTGGTGRHKSNHLHELPRSPKGGYHAPASDPKNRKSELDILDAFIQRGAQQIDLSSFIVSGEQLLRAIDLKQRLTQGSLFEDFYKAIGAEGDDMAAESAEAKASAEEQEQGAQPDGEA